MKSKREQPFFFRQINFAIISTFIAIFSSGYLMVVSAQQHILLADTVPVAMSTVLTPPQQRVSCNSNDMRRNYCNVDTRGGVRLYKQKSDSPCIQGRTWGYNRTGIWVDRGCRAEFEVGGGYGGGYYGGGYGGRTITCNSNDMRRNWCNVDTRGGVRLYKQKSDSPCIQGRTWGYNRDGIWVDRGCRAEFQIGR
ncbi:MAG: DUF3011 domain-containing protein [Acidobacteria bacterium]|nr:DUF3011 domain-containing protein [Acidobacteriota bacterium]